MAMNDVMIYVFIGLAGGLFAYLMILGLHDLINWKR